jgi:hypothetical protein
VFNNFLVNIRVNFYPVPPSPFWHCVLNEMLFISSPVDKVPVSWPHYSLLKVSLVPMLCIHSSLPQDARSPKPTSTLSSPKSSVYISPPKIGGTRYRIWLRHYATSGKVVGSIFDEVMWFFSSLNPCSRTMALGSIQPLTRMGTRCLPVMYRTAGA